MDGREGRMGRNRGREKAHLEAQIFPNPFNPETTVHYSLESPEHVKVRVYNIQGQLIRTLTDDYRPAGNHTVRWDGRLDNGGYAAAGIYIYRIDAGKQNLTGRMALMK
jgi:flagellar hook assembly protein FlgD